MSIEYRLTLAEDVPPEDVAAPVAPDATNGYDKAEDGDSQWVWSRMRTSNQFPHAQGHPERKRRPHHARRRDPCPEWPARGRRTDPERSPERRLATAEYRRCATETHPVARQRQ